MTLLLSMLLACAYLGAINIRCYRAFAHDKLCAINKEQRTPEAELLFLAKIGGWVGAKMAQKKLRHKSYKQPFGQQLNTIGGLQAACVVTLLLIGAALAMTPTHAPLIASELAAQPVDGQLAISLRPPAGRRAGL